MQTRIRGQLEREQLSIARTPNAGSYAKETGLRRYMHGNTKIGGSDVDVPIVLSAGSGDKLELKALLDLFEGLVRRSYPRTHIARTKSSIKIQFSSFKYAFDLVPMVAVRGSSNREHLFRADGSKIATSISGHVKFIKRRTQISKAISGRAVHFNNMIRLFKWWRELHADDVVLAETSTFLLELLCAKVFDDHGVAPNPDTPDMVLRYRNAHRRTTHGQVRQ